MFRLTLQLKALSRMVMEIGMYLHSEKKGKKMTSRGQEGKC